MPPKVDFARIKEFRCEVEPKDEEEDDDDDIEDDGEDISSEATITEDPWDWDINLESTLLLQ